MDFKEMDPELAIRLIEGQEDVLAGEGKKLDAFYRQFHCPRCETAGLQPEFTTPQFAFGDPNVPIPRAALRCRSCDCLFDPHNGILLEMGNPAKLPVEIPIIAPKRG